MNDFHQNVWDAWRNDVLNWNDIDTNILSQSPVSVEQKWRKEQEWILQDPNRFYHPLFGMGNHDSKVAFVAAGPGHNAETPWQECNDGAYREHIVGPHKNEELWWDYQDEDDLYKEEFEEQCKRWEKTRICGDVDIYDPLFHIEDRLNTGNNSGKFDQIYFTNFIKDGEFDTSSNSRSKDDHDDVKVSSDDPLLEKSFDKDSLICHNLYDCRWGKKPWACRSELTKEESAAEVFAREFWLPFLAIELETLRQNGNLELIVPLGNLANEAVSQLYDYETTNIKDDALYTKTSNGKVAIIPSIHFSMMQSNVGDIDKYDIKEVDDYCSRLVQEINEIL